MTDIRFACDACALIAECGGQPPLGADSVPHTCEKALPPHRRAAARVRGVCDCFKIGGPFIADDPMCPEHGVEAQVRERQARERIEARTITAEGVTMSTVNLKPSIDGDAVLSVARRLLAMQMVAEPGLSSWHAANRSLCQELADLLVDPPSQPKGA